jgi:6-phospho-beta-glucosidase
MTEMVKLSVLGGSGVATPGLIQALVDADQRPPIEVVLLGRTADKLERVAALSKRLAERASIPLTVNHTTDLRTGLEGSDYVLNQIRVGGYEARSYDESFPQAFGIPGEETFGPGGMNNALRTIPVTLEHCKLIEEVAPETLIINLTNPSSFIQYAISHYTDVGVVGVCDSPVWLAGAVASLAGAPPDETWVGYVGMHHFGWVTEASWRGRDIMQEVLKKIEDMPGFPVDVDIVQAMGAIPTSYFKYYYHSNRMLAKQQGKETRAKQLLALQAEIMEDLQEEGLDEMPASLMSRGAAWYQQIIVPVFLAHINDTKEVFIVNVRNGKAVPWMPEDAIVEVPAVVTSQGFYPIKPPKAPPDIQAMVRLNAAFEMLWVEAIVEKSYPKALRAMMLNHLVDNFDQARDLLKEIWPEDWSK